MAYIYYKGIPCVRSFCDEKHGRVKGRVREMRGCGRGQRQGRVLYQVGNLEGSKMLGELRNLGPEIIDEGVLVGIPGERRIRGEVGCERLRLSASREDDEVFGLWGGNEGIGAILKMNDHVVDIEVK